MEILVSVELYSYHDNSHDSSHDNLLIMTRGIFFRNTFYQFYLSSLIKFLDLDLVRVLNIRFSSSQKQEY